jgi:hypothetical protein
MGSKTLVSSFRSHPDLEFALACLTSEVRVGGSSASSLRGLSCSEFQRAQFLGDERGARVGIVFAAGE